MADKYIKHNAAGGFTEVEAAGTGGAGQANKIAALDITGRLDSSMMPTGIGAETVIVPSFGALAAGDLVNLFSNVGVVNARKADASSAVAPAHGFVLAASSDGANATVYMGGLNNAVLGKTPGPQYLSTTAGTTTATPPAVAGNIVQKVGIAVASNLINFAPSEPILLA